MIKIWLIYFSIIATSYGLNFPLSRSRETCFHIRQNGTYEFEFIVSGQEPEKCNCQIYDNEILVKTINGVAQQQSNITFQSNNGKFCFASLDNLDKKVSFDFISTSDPLQDQFSNQDLKNAHKQLFQTFQELQRLYRDQHFFLQRSQIHKNMLWTIQTKISFMIVFKLLIVVLAAIYQFFVLKHSIDKKNGRLGSFYASNTLQEE